MWMPHTSGFSSCEKERRVSAQTTSSRSSGAKRGHASPFVHELHCSYAKSRWEVPGSTVEVSYPYTWANRKLVRNGLRGGSVTNGRDVYHKPTSGGRRLGGFHDAFPTTAPTTLCSSSV